ncbi:hypothetical protein ACIBFB_05550 [Nocardiopsis sp. NPDC050513]|uniref:hypothetical protein n=1 Tax=Nocardiopsis sp. NPDC050513 TaxID=3364338 RepID=UPI00379557B4
MHDHDATLTEYERIYSAAARMLFLADEKWRGERSPWPARRVSAWRKLAGILGADATVGAEPGQPSDPTRHVLTQRTPDDRPVPLASAATAWQTRLDQGKGVQNPAYMLLEHPELHPVHYEAHACVIVSSGWAGSLSEIVAELGRRVAPGRPAYTVGPSAEGLSVTLHEIADHLRGAFTGAGPTPHPAGAARVSGTPAALVTDITREHCERLRAAALAAAAEIPVLEEFTGSKDVSMNRDVVDAAEILRQIARGSGGDPWRERGQSTDPSSQRLGTWRRTTFAEFDHELRERLFTGAPPPRVPEVRELAAPAPPRGGLRFGALSESAAFVVAEMVDEVAARLWPGRSVGTIGIDAYPLAETAHRVRGQLRSI